MGRLFDDGSAQHLEHAGAVVTAPPYSLAAWFRSDDASLRQSLLSLANSGTAVDFVTLQFRGDLGGVVRLAVSSAGASANVDTSTTAGANMWCHACGVVAAASDRRVYLNGGGKGTGSTSVSPAGLNRSQIGRLAVSGLALAYFSGRIAETAVWDAALTDNEVLALARGVAPWLVRPQSLVAYAPLWGLHAPEIDLADGALSWAVTGATPDNHAPVAPLALGGVPTWWEEVAAGLTVVRYPPPRQYA